MASFALLPIFGGMEYDLPRGHMGFSPIVEGNYRSFWSLGTGWGEFIKEGTCSKILLRAGSLTLKSIRLGSCGEAQAVFVDGKPISGFRQEADVLYFDEVTAKRQIRVCF